MNSSAVKIAIASLLIAGLTPAQAALSRSYANLPQFLSVNGVACPELESWSGGDARALVVVEASGSPTKKHLGNVAYEPITIVVNFPLSPALQNALADLCANRTTTQTLLLTDSDRTQLQVANALLIEARFPRLETAAKDALRLTLVFRPDAVQTLASSSSGPTVAGPGVKGAVGGNFRFTLAGLPGDQVTLIEGFTITRLAQSDTAGAFRLSTAALTSTQIPDLNVTISQASAPDWAAWRNDFIVNGNSDDAKEKSGMIEILGANLQTVLFPLQLSHVGIKRFARVPGVAAGAPERYLAELYCEGMSVASSPVTSTPPPPATPSTSPSTKEPTVPPAETAPTDTPPPPTSKTPAKEPQKTPEVPPTETSPTVPTEVAPKSDAAPSTVVENAPNPEDKGQRDPADFPRFKGAVRTQYEAVREKDYLREFARYTAPDQADNVMAFYEKYLTGSGWEEVARYEDNNGTNRTHRINATWKKSPRSATLTFTDVTKDSVDIQIILETRK